MFPTGRLKDYLDTYDPESRMREFNISRPGVGGLDRENVLYSTQAETPDALPPFLAEAIAKDRPRRNYYIVPGGRAKIFEGPAPSYPQKEMERFHSAPSAQLSLGNEGMPGYPQFRLPPASGNGIR